MKNIFKLLLLSAGLFTFWSCTKDENKNYFEGGTAPALTASKTGTIPLSFAAKDQEAIKLSWTNPAYKFTTGTSSQDVSYAVEIDTTGANFTNPNRKTIVVSKELSIAFTQNDFNDYLLNQLQLKPGVPHNVEIRVKSSLASNAVELPSNVLKFVVTPYAIPPKVTPPSSGELYIVGNATPGGDATGWDNPVPSPSQKFTRTTPTFYTLNIALNADKSYLLLPVNGSWTVKYGFDGANNLNNTNSFDFKEGGGDMKAPAVSGTYKIEVDFQRGKITVTKL
ncbi:MAG: hypothetical protein JWR72_2355 [Flavisolibacter sp.]|jgi:hypothetical protein|nr:hypothetical protein [Flavisolibacter sp.]